MRKILIALLVTTGVITAAPSKDSADPRQSIASFHYMTSVSKTDFRAVGATTLAQTFTITAAGTYVFVQDVTSVINNNASGSGASCAVYINSSDVILDLGNKTLAWGGSGTAPTTNGIEVAASLRNVSIKNGNVSGFKGYGIYVRSTCKNVRLQDVTISTSTKGGIYLAGSSGSEISGVLIQSCVVTGSVGTSAIAAIGLYATNSQSILVNNCMFSGNAATTATSSAYGSFITTCTGINFVNCDASNNTGAVAYGFYADSASKGLNYTGCTANGNFASATINGCGADAYGFYLNACIGCSFTNCVAAGNFGYTRGAGFGLISSSKYNYLKDCQALNNICGHKIISSATIDTKTMPSGTAGINGVGFYLNGGSGNVLENCLAAGNLGDNTRSGSVGVGFDMRTESYSLFSSCEARSNGDVGNAAWGIGFNLGGLASGTEANVQCVLKNCKAINNRSSTNAQALGIRDIQASSTSLVTGCFAFGNRDNNSTDNNFKVTYTNGAISVNSSVTAGGMSGITSQYPFENTTVVPS